MVKMPRQETRVLSQAQGDPTGHGATKPVRAATTEPVHLEPALWNKESHHDAKPFTPQLESSSPTVLQLEKNACSNEDLQQLLKKKRSHNKINKYKIQENK